MEWSFELSLTVFLVVAFVSQLISFLSRGRLSLPLAFGLIFMAGFSLEIFPKDFIDKTGLLGVGRIAFNVLIIHAGTMFSLRELKRNRKALLITLSGVILSNVIIIGGLSGLIGRELAILAAPSVVGGGATCAIASVSVMRSLPEISFFPWLIFMLQCLFGAPVFALMLKKEKLKIGGYRKEMASLPEARGRIADKMNGSLKGTAFYLMALMLLSLLNRLFFNTFFSGTGLSLNLTALLIGIVVGETGLIDRNPLQKADCFGLLMLGLMSLMAKSLANIPLSAVIALIPPALICFAVSTTALVLSGIALSRPLGVSRTRAVVIAISSLVPVPVNIIMIKSIIKPESAFETDDVARLIEETKMGSLYVINIFSVLLISIAVSFI
ncbi:MAG: hypothetical protein JEZ04_05380 [Spirochaetales bacterium]|nr:hypothetical protein [Spirochaetales bacterium]